MLFTCYIISYYYIKNNIYIFVIYIIVWAFILWFGKKVYIVLNFIKIINFSMDTSLLNRGIKMASKMCGVNHVLGWIRNDYLKNFKCKK